MLTTLEELQDDISYFVLICSTRRRRAYQEVLDESGHPIVVVDTPEEALRQVVRRPPIAVIVDMITGMRAGASNTSLLVLYNLELAWPVVRGTTKQNEPVSIVATSPQRTAPFVEALDSMIEGISEWTAPAAPRRYIRQAIQCRARVLPEGQKDWHRGTILELSAGGCYMVTYDMIAQDTQLEIEVRDIGDTYAHLNGRVVWSRGWEESTQLPGIGIAFDEATVPEALKDFLGTSFTGEG